MGSFSLTDRQSLTLSGITKIKSSEPMQIIAVQDGAGVVISGKDLTVVNANISTGELEVSGRVNGVRYTDKQKERKFSVKNLFK
ncbi:MAG: hypothetical protein LBM01_01660 [Christensenellaceae bacterium]|jgi:hypothetical protein|nr:hypothetical protein [Christensenellaceae bacterium]